MTEREIPHVNQLHLLSHCLQKQLGWCQCIKILCKWKSVHLMFKTINACVLNKYFLAITLPLFIFSYIGRCFYYLEIQSVCLV